MPRKIREVPWLDVRGGVYYAFWYNQDKRRTDRFSLKTSDPQKATEMFAAFLTDGKPLYGKGGPDFSVRDALDAYEREKLEKTVAVARNKRCVRHLRRLLGERQMRHVDVEACHAYAAARYKEGAGAATVVRELGALRAAAGHGVKTKRMTLAEMPIIEKPSVQQTKVGFYTKTELNFAINMAEGDLKDYLTILYFTGSRRTVIEQLEESQVDFAQGVIYQAKPGERVTKKRRLPIPLDDEVREILLRRSGRPGKRFFDGKDYYVTYRRHFEGLGMADRAHPHVMRHTRATLLLMEGVSIYKVAQRLCDTVATIEKTYAHAIVQDMANVGGRL